MTDTGSSAIRNVLADVVAPYRARMVLELLPLGGNDGLLVDLLNRLGVCTAWGEFNDLIDRLEADGLVTIEAVQVGDSKVREVVLTQAGSDLRLSRDKRSWIARRDRELIP